MRLLIVRHGEPNYENDTLTERGREEALALSERLSEMDIKEFYCSPLGRAQETALPTIKKMNRSMETLPWLREFSRVFMRRPDNDADGIVWDWLPEDLQIRPESFDLQKWLTVPEFQKIPLREDYEYVCNELDAFLSERGYTRNGYFYDVTDANNDTVVFFCHFGVEAVLLSHLLNISPMALWHGFCGLPTSITEVVTEERREGLALWRCLQFGSTEHLYKNGLTPSFAGRFRACYGNTWERKDLEYTK